MNRNTNSLLVISKEEGKDQESIQPGNHPGK